MWPEKTGQAAVLDNDRSSKYSKRIMLVDDEADILAVLAASFRSGGFAIHAYTNPKQALEDFKPHFYGALILDVRMPVMDGFELYQMIRKIDPDVNVCFFTAYETSHDVYQKTIAGVDKNAYFLRKPLSARELIKWVNTMITSCK